MEYFRIVSSSSFFSINALAISIKVHDPQIGNPGFGGRAGRRMRGIFSVVISINTMRQMTNSTIIYYNLTFAYRKAIRS